MDQVIELKNVPQSCVGAPYPVIICDERMLLLAYDVQQLSPNFEPGHILTDADMASFAPQTALVEFKLYYSYSFGAPNDEAINGHPLYERGLRSYSAFEVKNSSWIRELERRNSVHHSHNPKRFESLQHYVFTFHDSTFECVAREFKITEHRKSLGELLPEMMTRLTAEVL